MYYQSFTVLSGVLETGRERGKEQVEVDRQERSEIGKQPNRLAGIHTDIQASRHACIHLY